MLGVPGMNYSTLLNRSVDFDTYSRIFEPAYPSPLDRQLIQSIVQMLWDRAESNGYAFTSPVFETGGSPLSLHLPW